MKIRLRTSRSKEWEAQLPCSSLFLPLPGWTKIDQSSYDDDLFVYTRLLTFISEQAHTATPCKRASLAAIIMVLISQSHHSNMMIIKIYIVVIVTKVSGSKGGSNNLCCNHEDSDQQPGKPGLATFLGLSISITTLNISISIIWSISIT